MPLGVPCCPAEFARDREPSRRRLVTCDDRPARDLGAGPTRSVTTPLEPESRSARRQRGGDGNDEGRTTPTEVSRQSDTNPTSRTGALGIGVAKQHQGVEQRLPLLA